MCFSSISQMKISKNIQKDMHVFVIFVKNENSQNWGRVVL